MLGKTLAFAVVLTSVVLGFIAISRVFALIPGAFQALGVNDPTMLAMAGRQLSSEDAIALELQVKNHPNDLSARTKLLGYYNGLAHSTTDIKANDAIQAFRRHVLWLIRNRPEAEILDTPDGEIIKGSDPTGYIHGKRAWKQQVDRQPKSAKVLEHAANYLLLSDIEFAESLLRRAETVDPKNPGLPDKLAHLYSIQMPDQNGELRRKFASKSLRSLERALSLSPEEYMKSGLIQQAARMAFESGKTEKARKYAEATVKWGDEDRFPTGRDGDAIHHGNLVLGRIELKEGNVKKAKDYLLAAGRTPGSPPLDSFGPNMLLAKELLAKGERDVVLEYFELCGHFWHREELKQWAADVRAGKMPEFGANLVY